MNCLSITHEGIEDITSLELKELINKESKIEPGVVLFETESLERLLLFSQKSKSSIRILHLISSFNLNKNLETTLSSIKKTLNIEELKKLLNKKSFKVSCQRTGNHNFNSQDISYNIGKYIESQTSHKPEFKNPDLALFIYINNKKGYFGIDLIGKELNKRDYNIFVNKRALKGDVAYGLLRFSGYASSSKLCVLSCGSGMLAIEAAIFSKTAASKKEIYAFDSQTRNIFAAKRNATIAGVQKEIIFEEPKKQDIDLLISYMISPAKKISMGFITSVYQQFFSKTEKFLKKNGNLGVIIEKPDMFKEFAEKNKFKIKKERKIMQGSQKLFMLYLSQH